MPATLLAVDDSVTMRKVLEMTFAGEDFRVVTADSADAALAKLKSENPSLVLSDITLPGKNGYDLCTAIKRDSPGLPVLLLSSKLSPYDKSRGQAANANDFIDKPFDTQKLIDKVNALLSGQKRTMQGPPKPTATPYRAPAALNATLVGQGAPPLRPQAVKPAMATPARSAAPTNLRSTADFSARPIQSPAPRAPAPPARSPQVSPIPGMVKPKPAAPSATKPKSPPPAPTAPAAVAPARAASAPQTPVAAAAQAATGDIETKLNNLGLTKEQVAGVLALSNEIVERVVWEVVPVLAETMIKEELKRLTEES